MAENKLDPVSIALYHLKRLRSTNTIDVELRTALQALADDQLELVAIVSRYPIKAIRTLRGR